MTKPGFRPRDTSVPKRILREAATATVCPLPAVLLLGWLLAAGLMTASAGEPVEPQPIAPPKLSPTVPDPVSRPDGWPGRTASERTTSQSRRAGKKTDNHVLSTIRENPDEPIVPLESSATGSGVVQAQFQQPVQLATAQGVPSGQPVPSSQAGQGSASGAVDPLVAGAQSLETAMIVARVGPEVVLAGDLLTPSAVAWLEKVSPGLKPEQVRELKLQICRQLLPQHVESLIVFVDACRTIPEDRIPEIEKKVNEAFDQQQLPRLVKEAGLANSLEYEQMLKSRGQSLDRIRKTFFERALAQQWVQQKVTSDEEIPHAEMIAWYQNHLADYEFPARAKFEQLTVRITPAQSRDQAWDRLAAMGNDVLEGKPFADIARTRSEGPTAASGGVYDWTTKGSLASKPLDEVVFRLPVGQLSTIIADGTSLHIIRVTERTDAGRTPFIEAQVEIRESLQNDRRKREMDDYLARLKERTPVWTIFDDRPAAVTAAAGKPAAR